MKVIGPPLRFSLPLLKRPSSCFPFLTWSSCFSTGKKTRGRSYSGRVSKSRIQKIRLGYALVFGLSQGAGVGRRAFSTRLIWCFACPKACIFPVLRQMRPPPPRFRWIAPTRGFSKTRHGHPSAVFNAFWRCYYRGLKPPTPTPTPNVSPTCATLHQNLRSREKVRFLHPFHVQKGIKPNFLGNGDVYMGC